MIVDLIIYLFTTITTWFFGLLDVLFVGLTLPVQDLGEYIGYVFGNIMLFNSFLPVSEALVLASFALTFKLAMFGVQVYFFIINLFRILKSTFISIRL